MNLPFRRNYTERSSLAGILTDAVSIGFGLRRRGDGWRKGGGRRRNRKGTGREGKCRERSDREKWRGMN